MVLIPKGGVESCGIGLVVVVWKAVEVILNFRFTVSITYHDSLHGFQEGCGTGTTNFEIKLIQKVLSMKETVLHAILMELHKAFNTLVRSRCLDILEGYGVGTNDLRLLCRYWERLQMVAQTRGY